MTIILLLVIIILQTGKTIERNIMNTAITFEDLYFNDETSLTFNREAEFLTLTIADGEKAGDLTVFNLDEDQVNLLKLHLSDHLSGEKGSITFEDFYFNDGATMTVEESDEGNIEFTIIDEKEGCSSMFVTIANLDEEQVRVLVKEYL